jgi:hypothetical protein
MRETTQHSIANLSRAVKRMVGIVALTFIGVLFLPAQNSTPLQPSKAGHPPVSQSAAALPPIQLDESAVLSHLNQLINWYRHSITGIQPVGLPSDAMYQDNAKNLSSQILRLAFQSAKAEAAVLTAQQKKSEMIQPSSGSTQQQNLLQMQAKTSSQIEPTDRQNTSRPSERVDFTARCPAESVGTSESSS